MIEYKWEIAKLDVIPAKRGFAEVIRVIHWRYVATEGENAVDVTGSTPLPLPVEGQDYMAFDEITQDWCVERVLPYLDMAEIEAQLAGLIERMKDANLPREIATPFAERGRLATVGDANMRRYTPPDLQRDKAAFEAGLKRTQEAEDARAAEAEEQRQQAAADRVEGERLDAEKLEAERVRLAEERDSRARERLAARLAANEGQTS